MTVSLGFISTPSVPVHAAVAFYINLALVFFALGQMAAVGMICRKTRCVRSLGFATEIVFACGVVMFFVQLCMYAYNKAGAVYAVYIALALLYGGFAVSSAYCVAVYRKGNVVNSVVSGILCLVPPVGMFATLVLGRRMGRDTACQGLVYSGYAYTYAALAELCAVPFDFTDGSGEEDFEKLAPKQVRKLLKQLKKQAKSPEGKYRYASAIATYTPDNMRYAVRLIKKSAKHGYAPALFNLGYYCEYGIHLRRDLKKARQYYARAAQIGDGDAAVRLGIIYIKCSKVTDGIAKFKECANKGDLCAKFNLAVCAERGIGMPSDIRRAAEGYYECARGGLFAGQRRVVALAAKDIHEQGETQAYRLLTEDREYDGSLALFIKGLQLIKQKRAADAASEFLKIVKAGDRWEGWARCLVGTLYYDAGAVEKDRRNGAEYIGSALDILPAAKRIFAALPPQEIRRVKKSDKARKKAARKAQKQKTAQSQ